MNNKPMTDELAEPLEEKLAEIHELQKRIRRGPLPPSVSYLEMAIVFAVIDRLQTTVKRLLNVRTRYGAMVAARDFWHAEVDRLRAENAEMRPIVEAVANRHGRLSCSPWCNINERWMDDYPERHEQHDPSCLIAQARAFVEAHPTAYLAGDGGQK